MLKDLKENIMRREMAHIKKNQNQLLCSKKYLQWKYYWVRLIVYQILQKEISEELRCRQKKGNEEEGKEWGEGGEGEGEKKKNRRTTEQHAIKIFSKFDKKYKSTDSRNSKNAPISINTKKSTRGSNQIPEKLSKLENLRRSKRKKFRYREI